MMAKVKDLNDNSANSSPCLRQTLNLAQRSFKVIHFGGNRKPVCDFI